MAESRDHTLFSLAQVKELTGGRLEQAGEGAEEARVGAASIDTRTLEPGQLFFALEGESSDGHAYLREAASAGAAAAVVRSGYEQRGFAAIPSFPVISVEDPLAAMWALAEEVRARRTDLRVIGVTGSNGKTTTKDMLWSVFASRSGASRVAKNIKSYNNHLGVPLTLLGLEPEHEVLVAEIGMNAPGEIEALAGLAKPDIGVITSVGIAHLEGVKTVEGVARAKGEMFESLPPEGWAIIPEVKDDLQAILDRAASHLPEEHRVTFGRSPDAAVRIVRCQPELSGRLGLRLSYRGSLLDVSLPVVGMHNALNGAAAAAAALCAGCETHDVIQGLESFEPPPHRCVVKRCGGAIVLDDCYNANPTSMKASLDALVAMPGANRPAAVLGEMRELGDDSRLHHEQLGRQLADMGFEKVVLVGEMMRFAASAAVRSGMDAEALIEVDTAADVAPVLAKELGPGWKVLFKASRAVGLEAALDEWCKSVGERGEG
jgi:UDP-N-acetylmuramoyl-tripeptide--D-alanyl-D-alanine ligase